MPKQTALQQFLKATAEDTDGDIDRRRWALEALAVSRECPEIVLGLVKQFLSEDEEELETSAIEGAAELPLDMQCSLIDIIVPYTVGGDTRVACAARAFAGHLVKVARSLSSAIRDSTQWKEEHPQEPEKVSGAAIEAIKDAADVASKVNDLPIEYTQGELDQYF